MDIDKLMRFVNVQVGIAPRRRVELRAWVNGAYTDDSGLTTVPVSRLCERVSRHADRHADVIAASFRRVSLWLLDSVCSGRVRIRRHEAWLWEVLVDVAIVGMHRYTPMCPLMGSRGVGAKNGRWTETPVIDDWHGESALFDNCTHNFYHRTEHPDAFHFHRERCSDTADFAALYEHSVTTGCVLPFTWGGNTIEFVPGVNVQSTLAAPVTRWGKWAAVGTGGWCFEIRMSSEGTLVIGLDVAHGQLFPVRMHLCGSETVQCQVTVHTDRIAFSASVDGDFRNGAAHHHTVCLSRDEVGGSNVAIGISSATTCAGTLVGEDDPMLTTGTGYVTSTDRTVSVEWFERQQMLCMPIVDDELEARIHQSKAQIERESLRCMLEWA